MLYKYIHSDTQINTQSLMTPYHDTSSSPRALAGGRRGTCAACRSRGALVFVTCVPPESPVAVPVLCEHPSLLGSHTCSDLFWLSRSLCARIPRGFRPPEAAVALAGGEGYSLLSADMGGWATPGGKTSLWHRSESTIIRYGSVAAINVCYVLIYNNLL